MSKTTIAFTSCMDADEDQQQAVWTHIQQHTPDVLILLGDTIYMDFSFEILGSKKPRGKHNEQSLEQFAIHMHQRYKKQWSVASFQALIGTGIKIAITWDDHDFAWNNSRGQGHDPVETSFRLVSRGLFQQFKQQLIYPLATNYPPLPSITELLNSAPAEQVSDLSQGIQSVLDINDVRIVMLDGRTFRHDPTTFWSRALGQKPQNWMNGEAQLEWMLEQFQDWKGHKVIGAGSSLNFVGETWTDFKDYQWMLNHAPENAIVLTGDIHKNDGPNHYGDVRRFYEVTASGAARPGVANKLNISGASGNFGILTCAQQAQVKLFKFSEQQTESILYTRK